MLAGLDACIRITTDQLTADTTGCRCQSYTSDDCTNACGQRSMNAARSAAQLALISVEKKVPVNKAGRYKALPAVDAAKFNRGRFGEKKINSILGWPLGMPVASQVWNWEM